MRIMVAAGGTGGHIFPALAVLRTLARQRPDLEVIWLGGRRGLESDVVPPAGYPLDRLWLRTLRTVDLSVATIMDPVRLGASVPQAMAVLARRRPDVLYTTGGYVAIPALAAARTLRVPSLLWEGNRLAGRSVRATARLASAIAVSYAGTGEELPGRTFHTGTPTRDLADLDRAASRARLGLPADLPMLLVFGGSQAVRRFNEAVTAALPDLVTRAIVLHVAGELGMAEATAARAALPEALQERYRPVVFLGDEMADALAAADLLVGRAGSSTIAEATAVGLPLLVVPYPHAAGHQVANTRELVAAGGARLVRDEDFGPDTLREVADLMTDHATLDAMRVASRSMGRPGAARVTAELLEALASREPLPDPADVSAAARSAA